MISRYQTASLFRFGSAPVPTTSVGYGSFTCKSLTHPNCALLQPLRFIIQSKGYSGSRNIFDQQADNELARRLRGNANGNYYRHQQKLWPSQEALERDLTELNYSPVERSPLVLLPQKAPPARVFAFEGRGATALLQQAANTTPTTDTSSLVAKGGTKPSETSTVLESDQDVMDYFVHHDQSVQSKILSEEDLDGTVLASARERVREVITDDLNSGVAAPSLKCGPTEVPGKQRILLSSFDQGMASWASLGLDPVMSHIAAEFYGPYPSRLQSRLLPALLHEDHNDVLFNGVHHSGKTSALVLAILQGVRCESAGFNVLVAANTLEAMRLHSTVKALCRRGGGGKVVDRPADDDSWLFFGTTREDYAKYFALLRKGLRSAHGPARLFVTTADVFCQLLFERKMEFEDFGYLRRVYLDDVGVQMPILPENAPVVDARERLRNPLAAELLLGTLHQLAGPHIRSILQLGLVSADVDDALKDHLKALCIKPEAHTIVLAPVRIPSTVHCLFSFHLYKENVFEYTARLIWNARHTIPGRAIIFIAKHDDILHVRRKLRGLGMNVKLFSEVYANGNFETKWKFLLLREADAFGVDLPLVSHVFITYAPASWQAYMHLCGRTGRFGNVGWVYTITDRRDAPAMRVVAEDVSVEFRHHVLNVSLQQVDPADVNRWSKAPELYGMDPQYAVRQHYEVQAENPDMAYRSREFFSKPVTRQFQMEDYTPTNTLQRRFTNANLLARDIANDPSIALKLKKSGLLSSQLKPTPRLKRRLEAKSSKKAPPPF